MKCNYKITFVNKTASAFTLIELMTTVVIATIPIAAIGLLLVSGQRRWESTYDSATKQIKLDATVITAKFGNIARKSNLLHYKLYENNGGSFAEALSSGSNAVEVVAGNAVELRYWDVPFSADILDVNKLATAYALFYLDADSLKVDYGSYPPGAVSEGGGPRNTPDRTEILANNVIADPNTGAFNHTTINGVGQGCIRINFRLTDPDDGETITVKTAALIRNVWPR